MSNIFQKIHMPKGKGLLIIGIIIAILIVALLVMSLMKGDEAVDFRALSDAEIPQDITSSVIPEYRDLERALACMVDGKVYVVVTRGEKPTSGFEIAVDKMVLEENDGKNTLAVYCNFKDPEPGTALAQVLTYPLQVAETEMNTLPDQIELRVQYE